MSEEQWDLKEWPVQTHLRSKTMDEHIEKIQVLFGDKLSPWIPVTPEAMPESNTDVFMNHGGLVDRGSVNTEGQWWLQGYKVRPPESYMPIPPLPAEKGDK